MDSKQLESIFIKAVHGSLEDAPKKITRSTLMSDLVADSLDSIAVMVALEDALMIPLGGEELLGLDTVGDAIDALGAAIDAFPGWPAAVEATMKAAKAAGGNVLFGYKGDRLKVTVGAASPAVAAKAKSAGFDLVSKADGTWAWTGPAEAQPKKSRASAPKKETKPKSAAATKGARYVVVKRGSSCVIRDSMEKRDLPGASSAREAQSSADRLNRIDAVERASRG